MITLRLPPTTLREGKGGKLTLTHPVFIGDHGDLLLTMTTGSAPLSSNTSIERVELSSSSTSASNSTGLQAAATDHLNTAQHEYKTGDAKAPAALHRVNALVPPTSGNLT